MKIPLFALLLISLSVPTHAQELKGKGVKISGLVKDSLTSKGVEYANVALVDPATEKPINGSVADDKGKFTINNVAPGTYSIEISFVGFESKRIDDLKVSDKNIDIDEDFYRAISHI